MITEQEWQEYEEYWQTLSAEEKIIELDWLETIGKAKKNGSTISSIQPDTLQ